MYGTEVIIRKLMMAFSKFSDIFFDHYESYNQITFFVPNDEKQYTLNELTDILI